MTGLIFVAPYGLESTMRFVSGAASLPDIAFGLISHEPAAEFLQKLEPEIRDRIAGYSRIPDALDPDQLEAGVRDLAGQIGGRVDAILGILEPLQEPLAEVRFRLGIDGMHPDQASNFRDKSRMKSVMRSHGLPCANHRLVTDPSDALAFAERHLPLVAKPPAGAGAIDTIRIDDTDQLQSWLSAAPPTPQRPLLLEEFIQGDEFSFDSVSVRGEHVFHSISTYAPTPLEVMETPWIQWTVLLPRAIDGTEYDAIRDAGPKALTALGMSSGLSHMEWFRRADGTIAISEVAARPPGAQITSMMNYAYDYDFYRGWAEASVFHRFEAPQRRYATGAAYLRGQGQGYVAGVQGIEAIQNALGDLVVEAKLPTTGQPKVSSYEGEGYVIIRHPETDVVAEGLERIVSTMRVHLERGAASGGGV